MIFRNICYNIISNQLNININPTNQLVILTIMQTTGVSLKVATMIAMFL